MDSTTEPAEQPVHALYVPPHDPERDVIDLPITEVVVFEDRALIKRSGPVAKGAGHHRLTIMDVAPVLQDVSLRAEASSGARVSDTQVRRAARLEPQAQPEELRALEAQLEQLRDAFYEAENHYRHLERRHTRLSEVLGRGLQELPEDAAWGRVDVAQWDETFESICAQARALQREALQIGFDQEDRLRDWSRLVEQRRVLERPDQQFVAWIEVDLVVEQGEQAELAVHYMVPGALWRPLYAAVLHEDRLELTASGVVWQNTGEDWSEVQLVFSTARSSLGTDPPMLADDLLEAHKRPEQTQVQARQVAIASAQVRSSGQPGSAARTTPVARLPGVDDGGDVQRLRPERPSTVLSDGRPATIALHTLVSPMSTERVVCPEIEPQVVLRCVAHNTGPVPLLAGPVELIRNSGPVGWTQTLFVAPGEPLELSFGPEDNIRVQRTSEVLYDEVDPIDKHRRHIRRVRLDLSNLGAQPLSLRLTERVPVSEIAEVQVRILDEDQARAYDARLKPEHRFQGTSPDSTRDPGDGLIHWSPTLGPWARQTLELVVETLVAPGIDFEPL